MKLFKKAYYEKVFAKKETTITDCYEIIRAAEEKIKQLRATCSHEYTRLGMYMWRPGAFNPSILCMSCDAVVPGITEEQAKQVWDDWNKGQSSSVITIFTETK